MVHESYSESIVRRNVDGQEDDRHAYVAASISLGALLVSVVLTFTYISLLASQRNKPSKNTTVAASRISKLYVEKLSGDVDDLEQDRSKPTSRTYYLNITRRILVVFYIAAKIVYSVTFTFAATLALVTFSFSDDLANITRFDSTLVIYLHKISEVQGSCHDWLEMYFVTETEWRAKLAMPWQLPAIITQMK